jgi:hypothetical protein
MAFGGVRSPKCMTAAKFKNAHHRDYPENDDIERSPNAIIHFWSYE